MHSMYSLAWKKHRVALQVTAPILKTLLWSIPGPPTHVKPPHNQDKKLLQLKNKENVDFLPQNWAACGFSPRRHSGWPCGLFQANHPRGSENSRLLVRISGSNSSKTAWDPQVPLTCLCLYLAVFQWNICKMLQVYILKHLEPILILRVHQRTNPPEVVAKVHPNQVHVQRSAPPALSSQSQLERVDDQILHHDSLQVKQIFKTYISIEFLAGSGLSLNSDACWHSHNWNVSTTTNMISNMR